MTNVSVKGTMAFIAGVLLLLAHRAFPLRCLCIVFLLLPLFPARRPMAADSIELWVLDVGQGLAVVVQTRDAVVVYDTGAGDPAGPNMASSVLVPFLQGRGIREIDLLVLSHGDRDHAGGVYTLHEHMRVLETWYGDQPFPGLAAQSPCLAGRAQRFGELRLLALHPGLRKVDARANNRSCVLLLEHRGFRVLLPGDIEAPVERQLLQTSQRQLRADVLVVPHHGSKTSSSSAFIRAVAPQLAVFSHGYRNRFGHPHPRVLARYRRLQVAALTTADSGAVQVRAQGGRPAAASTWRERRRYYWH